MNSLRFKSQVSRRMSSARRGNTLVLVIGILVLLVIIATAYITRTQAGRTTAMAQQLAGLRDDSVDTIAEGVSQQIGDAVFPNPIDASTLGPGVVPTANTRRLGILPNAVRYGQDTQDNSGDGYADYPWNRAPYSVRPYTNWPDPDGTPTFLFSDWPPGPGNLSGPTAGVLSADGNEIGWPGFNDCRWLRDLEPLRYTTGFNSTPVNDAPSHYRHLSYLGTIDNGWRVCTDISDVFDVISPAGEPPRFGSLVTNLNLPIEQWLAIRPPNLDSNTGTAYMRNTFLNEWADWFGLSNPANPLLAYSSIYADLNRIPNNYYRLKDLNGNGVYSEVGERPQDEFVPGTPRWMVSRILADTDGDGFTDSFWWLSPLPVQNGIRQVVAFSVIDNCSMINVNVAGQFIRDGNNRKTRGSGPFDAALAGQMANPPTFRNNYNVGFYDNPDHQMWPLLTFPGYSTTFYYDTALNAAAPLDRPWQRHLTELGYPPATQIPKTSPPDLPNALGRLDFWQRCSSQPLSSDTTSTYHQFNLDSEIELRMFAGSNYPWIFSNYEFSVNDSSPGGPDRMFLRSGLQFEENNEIRDQRSGRENLVDSRHHITTYSAARNDIAAPWLWPHERWADLDGPTGAMPAGDLNGDNVVDGTDDLIFALSSRKFDLRMSAGGQVAGNLNENQLGMLQLGPANPRNVGIVLRDLLERAMIDPINVPSARQSYYGNSPTDILNSYRLCTAMAACINEGRDSDQLAPVADAVVVNDPAVLPANRTEAFIGMEKQPFLVEAFVAHVHKATTIAAFNHPGTFIQAGDAVICKGGTESTIVVVQIANPFDTELDLSNFKIKVFGQPLVISSVTTLKLAPNEAMSFYSMQDPLNGDITGSTNWRQLLKLDQPFANAVAVPSGVWSYDRSFYDSANPHRAIEITRDDASGDVLVDRIDIRPTDDFVFGEKLVSDLPDNMIIPMSVMETCVPEPADGLPWNVFHPGKPDYAQWIRVTRAWEWDVNGNGTIEANELNPRYVFPDRLIDLSQGNGAGFEFDNNDAITLWFPTPSTFDARVKGTPPTNTAGNAFPDPNYKRLRFPMQMLQKDGPYDQIGELLNVWMYGHQIKVQPGSNPLALDPAGEDGGTVQTFTEYLSEDPFSATAPPPGAVRNLVGHDVRVNRLRTTPIDLDDDQVAPPSGGPTAGFVVGFDPVGNSFDPRHGGPALPAAVRIFDGVVCDGIGNDPLNLRADLNYDGSVNAFDAPLNAKGFDGTATPGMINLNGPYEVLQSNPQWYRLVHETGLNRFDNSPTYAATPSAPMALVQVAPDPNARMPRSMIPEALVTYRERFDGLVGGTGYPFGPNYSGRGNPLADPLAFLPNMRCGRGIESIGEVALLTQSGQGTVGESPAAPAWPIVPQQWRIDLDMMPRYDQTTGTQVVGSGFVPIVDGTGHPESMRISTDDTNPRTGNALVEQPDDVALDAEEMNLLFASASNMITTRSDTFTVYFRVRSFRQNTSVSPPVWDAMNPEYIIDDSRYVMLIDRSNVNKPGDKPKILYMEKLPN